MSSQNIFTSNQAARSDQYEQLMRFVFDHGVDKSDRTGTGTRSHFGYQMRFDLQPVSYTHLTLPTILRSCRSRWSPYH